MIDYSVYKTIKQIADEIGINKQRVYRYIKKNCISEAHQNNGMMYYDETAKNQIERHFSVNTVSTEAHHDALQSDSEAHQCTSDDTVIDTVVSMLQSELEKKNHQIDILQEDLRQEREHSRQQADKLSDLSQQLAELTRNSQVLLKQEQNKTAILLPDQLKTSESTANKNKRPFWQLWKKDNRKD